uniref:Recombination signal binding protein for immunoglobulin kappa J region-like n=1 Tax=Labrus bergylta TaxID=56723 RepID=A0A3Q3G9K9_9LABR
MERLHHHPGDPSRVVLNDGSCWTIIGVEVVEYTFNQGLACIQTPVTPFPVITGLEVNGGGHVAMLEIEGENFSPHLKVWFGNKFYWPAAPLSARLYWLVEKRGLCGGGEGHKT